MTAPQGSLLGLDGYIDETTHQYKNKRGQNVPGGNADLGEDQGDYVHLHHEKEKEDDAQKEDHKQESQGIKKHEAFLLIVQPENLHPLPFRLLALPC